MTPIAREKKSNAAWPGYLLLFVLLLVAPAWAIYRGLGPNLVTYAAGWLTGISLLSFALYGFDKRRATKEGERTPEAVLHLLELLGGWPGAFLGQQVFRHKTAKVRFQIVFWSIVLLYQAVSLDYLMDWPAVRAAIRTFSPA
jgi:uncharacterized membrane protein YsdA (DUF1294 family)